MHDTTTRTEKTQQEGLWGWVVLYLTGAFLLVFLFVHLGILHYSIVGPITVNQVAERLRSPAIQILDLGLLALALFHGLTGLRRVVLDLGVFTQKAERFFFWVLMGFGGFSFLFGLWIFKTFLGLASF